MTDTDTDLDALIERARTATVDRSAAERYVGELERRERAMPRPRRWVAWLAAGLAAAAAAVAVFWLWPRSQPETAALVSISDRVTIITESDTVYRVTHSGADGTTLTVERGAVTARLWPGARPYHLALTGGGVTAVATGTVYSLAIRARSGVVSVLEGTVEVHTVDAALPDGVHSVRAGQTWPPGRAGADRPAGRALLALRAPPRGPATPELAASIDAGAASPPDAGEPVDAPAPEAAAEGVDAGAPASDVRSPGPPRRAPAPVTPTIKDRWRTARLLRGQGQLDRALAECLAIADARDATWSPIALVEAVRIELGPLADPGRAIELVERMLREWPDHALSPEARELRCRALRQLGRDGECAAVPQR